MLPLIFSCALFGSAFLSFSVQPILGKMLLPMVGGAPAGWIVAMAFFQLALLAGYGISWALERFSAWVHAIVLLLLFVAGSFYLPPVLPQISAGSQGMAMSFDVVGALFRCIFVPFLALTATTAALQRVFAATKHPTAKDPYYLFVASNIGSFAGLLMYPFALEPLAGIQQQTHIWQVIYAVVIVLIITALVLAWQHKAKVPAKSAKIKPHTKVTTQEMMRWLALAFVPCSLSMGVTTLITTDVTGVPLVWVIPLGLYLLTFVLAFSAKQYFTIEKLGSWQTNVVGVLVLMLAIGIGFRPEGSTLIFIVYTIALLEMFFATALMCHTRLAAMRPAADRLALFYFFVALGGGLAGILHAFVLPFVLKDVIEFPIVLLLSLLLHPNFFHPAKTKTRKNQTKIAVIYCYIALVMALAISIARHYGASLHVLIPLLVVFAATLLMISSLPRALLLIGVAMLAGSLMTRYPEGVLMMTRNFFGAQAVYDTTEKNGVILRSYSHGHTVHGVTVFNGTEDQKYHSAYYVDHNPIYDVLVAANAKSIGVIGLGAGQMACYKRGLTVDFYEIDEDVKKGAEEYFPYLKDCPPRDIFLGDGRLVLGRENRIYDVLMADAFTSDGVPLHLLTREAIMAYRQHVGKNGIILFNTSNNFFDLRGPLAAIAKAEGLTAYTIFFHPNGKNPFANASKWVAIPVSKEAGRQLLKRGWKAAKPASFVWTDDHSSLIPAFTFNPMK
jgi:spermidine synthase